MPETPEQLARQNIDQMLKAFDPSASAVIALLPHDSEEGGLGKAFQPIGD